MPNTNVSEVHAYPLRPPNFEEPLFPTADSKRAIVEHLLMAPWLTRASQLEGHTGEAVHAPEGPVKLRAAGAEWSLCELVGVRDAAGGGVWW